MPEPMRYGIIGTGMMGCEHILNLKLMDDVTVSAIADSNETSRGWGAASRAMPSKCTTTTASS